jgi:hypothetical protein
MSSGWIETSRLYAVDPVTPIASTLLGYDNETPEAKAIEASDLPALDRLIERSKNRSDEESAILSTAARQGNLTGVDAMLKRGVVPDAGPLVMVGSAEPAWSYNAEPASYKIPDFTGVVRRLLSAGANINGMKQGITPLFSTIDNNNLDMAELFLKNGADVNAELPDEGPGEQLGYTPLMHAVIRYFDIDDPTMMKLLLDHGANPNFSKGNYVMRDEPPLSYAGKTPLVIAAENGSLTLTRLLLDHGANPTLPRDDGDLPADIARKGGFLKVADLIDSYAVKQH